MSFIQEILLSTEETAITENLCLPVQFAVSVKHLHVNSLKLILLILQQGQKGHSSNSCRKL